MFLLALRKLAFHSARDPALMKLNNSHGKPQMQCIQSSAVTQRALDESPSGSQARCWPLLYVDSCKRTSSDVDEGCGELQNGGLHSQKQKASRINARVISDATIGLSDGLTVPFALTAGLSAFGSTRIVIYGGLAELIAGAISMGIGGYLGAKTEAWVLWTGAGQCWLSKRFLPSSNRGGDAPYCQRPAFFRNSDC